MAAQLDIDAFNRTELWAAADNYNDAWSAPVADDVNENPSSYIVVGQLHTYSGFPKVHYYRVTRSFVKFNLVSLPPCVVFEASFESEGAWATRGLYARCYDGTGLTGVPADFYAIRLLTDYVGQVAIPIMGWSPEYPWTIPMDDDGKALIASKAGGTLILALRSHWEQNSNPPGNNVYDEFYPQKPNSEPCTLHITYMPLSEKDKPPARVLNVARVLPAARALDKVREIDP